MSKQERPDEGEQLDADETVDDLEVPGDHADDVMGGVRKAGGKQLDY